MKRILLSMLTIGMICSSILAQNDVLPLKAKGVPMEMAKGKSSVTPSRSVVAIPLNNSPSEIIGVLPEDLITVTPRYYSTGGLDFQNKYDRQTQGTPYEMMYVHDDRFIGGAWTAASADDGALATRGIAYTCSKDQGKTWDVEFPVGDQYFTYWPSYMPWGEKGELIFVRVMDENGEGGLSHNGAAIFRREVKGVGDWEFFTLDNPKDNGIMLWQRCCVTGENNEYLHVAIGFSFDDTNDSWNGYTNPMIYNRSSDGGKTWDYDWTVLPDLVGETWKPGFNYTEDVAWTTHGSEIALIGATMSQDCIILKSTNHGEPGSWKKITVYECANDMTLGPNQKIDSGFRALMADVSFDNEGKLHAVMSVFWAKPGDQDNYFSYKDRVDFCGLLYWNEDRGTYTLEQIDAIYEAWKEDCYYMYEEAGETYINLYAVSKKMNEYFVGGPIPIKDTEGEVADDGVTYYDFNWITTEIKEWALNAYGQIGLYVWPQIFFDGNNGLHLIYASPLDGEVDGGDKQRRHIFHTYTPDEFKTFNHHTDINDFLAIKNNEFAYPYVGGWIYDGQFAFIVQSDPLVGTGISGTHTASNNAMYSFSGTYKPENIETLGGSSIPMIVYPNPAIGTVKVEFTGKCNIELYNMVGQKVYQIENVTDSHQISLDNLASGVYFITLRDGKKTATQKLIVQ